MYVVATTVTNINTILGISVQNPLHFKFFPVRCYHGKISKPPLLCFTTQGMQEFKNLLSPSLPNCKQE